MTTFTCCKYLRSCTIEDARCEENKRTKIVIAKATFWQNEELMRRNVKFLQKVEDAQLLCFFNIKLYMRELVLENGNAHKSKCF